MAAILFLFQCVSLYILATGKVIVILNVQFADWYFEHSLWNDAPLNDAGLHWWLVNIGSDNPLVPSGNWNQY